MTVAIVDYGSGNLRSAAKAFERASLEAGLGLEVVVTGDPEAVAVASHVVLPGVGAFADCMGGLERLPGMIDALEQAVLKTGKPFFGICVGMQLMATGGHEHGYTPGLNWVSGQVVPVRPSDQGLKVPHMGWNNISLGKRAHPIFKELPGDPHVYFTHSYQFVCNDISQRLASFHYGTDMTAAIGKDNLVGTQFHPEKSQTIGIQIIKNFLLWRP